jgi:GntR family transcriptional regulator
MLTKQSSTPLHIQLTSLLREQILHKALLPNTRLPSERDLCTQYPISRITVRQALSTLAQEGLVHSTVGKGTFVAVLHLSEELQPLSSFTQDLQRRGMQASSRVLDCAVIPANDELAARLRIPRGAEVVRLHRLRLANDAPIATQLTHLPHHLCPDLLRFDFNTRSLYEVLRGEYGLRLALSDTTIEAALAQPEEAALLDLRHPAAVLISEQITCLENSAVIEITRSIFHAERYKLSTHSA